VAPARGRRKRPHLQLIENKSHASPVLASPAAREEFKNLTQQLVDIAIEITDLIDGDPDMEPNGDEFEEGEGL
jgi:hypothetical protein